MPARPESAASELIRRQSGELAARFHLDAPAAGQLACLASLLGESEAPTAVHDPKHVLADHLADSLVGLEVEPVRSAATIADLGSGAGLPGLVLAIARPEAEVELVESNERKVAFIRRASAAASIANVTAVSARAEAWSGGIERFELVTARALAALPVVAEYAAPLLVLGGHLVVWRGRRDPGEEADARRAAAELGLEMADPIRVQPYAGARDRHLQLMRKVAPTPLRFPRRPGIAHKRPLGALRARPSDR